MMQAGFSQRDITPTPGNEMPGMFEKRFAESVHDPLWVTAAVFADAAGQRVAIVGVDALSVRRSVVLQARAGIEQATGIPGAQVMIAASHTHNGGPLSDVFLSAADPQYCQRVALAIIDAVTAAWQRREDCVLKLGSGDAGKIAFNRRFRLRGGCECTHPGRENPEVVDTAGPVDEQVGTLGVFSRRTGALLGCVVNFACHCTVNVGGKGYSADYPYYLREAVKAASASPEAVVVFLNGACGDITQVDNLKRKGDAADWGEPCGRQIGWALAGEAIKVLGQMAELAAAEVACVSDDVLLAVRPVPDADGDRARLAARNPALPMTRDEIFARERVLLAERRASEVAVSAEVQVIRVGPLAIVANPAEYFCAYGIDIKARSPHALTWVVELANGCVGYTPGYAQVMKSEEGYEARLSRSSKLQPEAGSLLAEASVALLQACHKA